MNKSQTSLAGLWVLSAAIIAWLTMPPKPGAVAQTPPAKSMPTPAAAASTQAAPLSTINEKALEPKDTFKDCANCPEMMMVTISRPLAVGRFEVTFDEWDECAADGGCRQPVIFVSWEDAKGYVAWLSNKDRQA